MKLLMLFAIVLLVGCGSERTEQQNTTEQEVYELGPVAVETPFGTVVAHKTGVVRRLARYRTTTEQQQYTFPEARDIGGAILGGVTGPLAGGGLVGLAMAWLMKRANAKSAAEKAKLEADRQRLERQRNEIVDGIEAAKSKLPELAWGTLTETLERKQSRDTIEAVKARVG